MALKADTIARIAGTYGFDVTLQSPSLRRAVLYLEEHVEETVSLDVLAGASKMSKFRLIRMFKSAFGLPPHAFHMALKLRLARELLCAGQTGATAAHSAGFTDQSHLHRWMRRVYDVTPRQMRSVRTLVPCATDRSTAA